MLNFKKFILLAVISICTFSLPALSQPNPQLDWLNLTLNRIYPAKTHLNKKMKTIEVEVGIKRSNARIENTGKKYIYTFNQLGKIESFIEVNRQEYNYDSTFTFHYYNTDTRVHIARTYNKGRYTATYETFDENNRIIKYLVCAETNLSDDFRFFKLGQQTSVQSETYTYQQMSDNQTRKKYFNDNNLVYKEGILYTDVKNKQLKEEDYTFITTGVRINYTNTFDDKGRILETLYSSDAAGDLRESTRFTYEGNNLTEEKYYRNSAMRNQRYYFYDKENSELESILCKYSNDYLIEIFNFSFSYY